MGGFETITFLAGALLSLAEKGSTELTGRAFLQIWDFDFLTMPPPPPFVSCAVTGWARTSP